MTLGPCQAEELPFSVAQPRSTDADVKRMVERAGDRFGRLDCLMNNAGRSSQYAAIADVDLAQFDAVIAAIERWMVKNRHNTQ